MTELLNIDFTALLAAIFAVLGSFTAFLGALYALSLIIPGEQPDKAIKALYDFTLRFSKK